ncbi:MAG TPA: diaminopimelate epimerase [Ruminococcaceae bacterium]|nr:diaminopimelate epimerase [Oscillospiraceae bacterium]HBG55552.1 diaminopimelate epimerase [Oscillospiraceae bacterium]HBQ45770.1 diaminopimelate epimerase [Oscillospiraceae bacterium]HBT91436.1 diaminopimelate epimerase [Oscillospiraceae bacterium]HCB90982.1 diaminopimelate epimerase [Oscillospiraceae bacterium]
MKFTKMQGIGNDYIYVNGFEENLEDPSALAARLSDRHFGIGSDGLIVIAPSKVADCRMDMYNADGSRGKMCGNGIRCVGKYVYERGIAHKPVLTVETLSGVKTLSLETAAGKVRAVEVDMGKPVLEAAKIPARFEKTPVVDEALSAGGRTYRVTCVSMGNPHCVLFVDDVLRAPVGSLGPKIELHSAFPEQVNTEFVQVLSREEIRMRVWERGSGETLACGTGACACAVACALNGRTGRAVLVHLRGGDLSVRWDGKTGRVFMKGPAEFVFDGTVET